MKPGIFVTYRGFIEPPFGGVQVCTREYIEVIKAAGIDLTFCTFEGDRRLTTRLLRRFNSSPYFRPAESRVIGAIVEAATKSRPEFVFLNQVDLAPLAGKIRRVVPPGCKIVLLSHGLASTDLLHLVRARKKLPLSGRLRPMAVLALGNALIAESMLRSDIDIVYALSPFDVELEHWIGSKHVRWLPRIIKFAPLDWRPTGDRLGFIGTLDHAPNLEGLVMVLDQLALRDTRSLRIRVVGGPLHTGRWLEGKYPIVDYLGAIDDATLSVEAASWNAVIHPIFCYARGCSTKLATVIGWDIPVVTTAIGHRGYVWRDGGLVVADEPGRFAHECLELLKFEAAVAARDQVTRVGRSSPTLEENALLLQATLMGRR